MNDHVATGQWLDVCAVGDIEPGDFKTVWIDDIEVAIINVDGQFHAIEDMCNHDGGELTGGCIDGNEIECPRHGARFNIATGEVLAPPAYENVDTYQTRVHEGRVEV